MSKSADAFKGSIKDAEDLLAHFDAMPKPPPDSAEVLKRAGLVMALTAWETYVEDRVREELDARLRAIKGSHIGKFVSGRLEEELKRFHNPTADKTKKLFLDYLELDVTAAWEWQQIDAPKARKTLDELISKRGDAVHRSKPQLNGLPPAPHLMKRDDLERSIKFLKSLVDATDKALNP